MMLKGFYPGSFDPLTFGHLDIITRGLSLVNSLVIGVGVSATKKPIFSTQERIEMITQEIANCLPDQTDKVQVTAFEGLMVNAAEQYGANVILRGLRNTGDFNYEAQMANINRQTSSPIETVFLAASPEISHISSTQVRQIAQLKGDVSMFCPTSICEKLITKLN
jgi:pantetheine-phosphate adenylyltransferase